MKKKVIVHIAFNTKNMAKDQKFTKDWIENRIHIFTKYTLQSLKNQTNQQFTTLVRYEDESKAIIKQALKQYDPLPSNVIFIKESKYNRTLQKHIEGFNYLYLARIDSDDMYHQNFIQQLHDYQPKENTVALINQKGYLYDSIHHRLCKIRYSSPPFHTLIYRTKEYLEGKRYYLRCHTHAIKLPHEILDHRNFTVVIHSTNTSSKFKPKSEKDLVAPHRIDKVLRKFLKHVDLSTLKQK